MVEFKSFCEGIKETCGIKNDSFLQEFNTYLIDNSWFGITPKWEDGKMFVDPAAFAPFLPKIKGFFEKNHLPEEERSKAVWRKLKHDLPDTGGKLERFYTKFDTPEHVKVQVAAFILKYVKTDVIMLSDAKLTPIIEILCEEETKQVGDSFTTFLSWVRKHYKTRYYREYIIKKRCGKENNCAYDTDDYLHLIYFLYCPSYIEEHDMYRKAAESKKYADTWLYLALHVICALRDTDIQRIYHPVLKREPKEILTMVKNGTFPESEAREILYSITRKLKFLPLRPNKTKKSSNITDVKFHVPESAETHLGTLFALAEAHRLLAGVPDDASLIKCIKTYDEIKRNMGEEIGSLFLEGDFRTRSINKSYLQSIFMMTDDILGHNDDFATRGYMLAALARSHKSSYGEFAQTTYTYLKDAKLSGLTPEFVARELFERGVLSCIPSMLLKTLCGDDYKKLSVTNQTKMIKALNLSPAEIETAVAVSNTNLKKSTMIVKELYQTQDRDTILRALHRIGNGVAVSKQDECGCLLSAFGKICPYDDNRNCVCCDYEISTKATLFVMAGEYNRLMTIYKNTDSVLEKRKCADILKTVVLPAMDEMLRTTAEVYGEGTLEALEKILKEKIDAA